MSDLTALVEEIAEVDTSLKDLNARRKDLRADILTAFENEGLDMFEVDGVAKVTLSKPKSLVLDYDKLVDLAPDDVVEKITVRVIDKEKLEAAIKLGDIDNGIVDAISSYKKQSPRLTVTVKLDDPFWSVKKDEPA